MPFAVVQCKLDVPARLLLERAMCCVPDFTSVDAAKASKDAYGVLLKDLRADQAQALQAALAREGIESRVVEQDRLFPLSPARKVRRADCLDDCLVIYDALGRPQKVAWRQVLLLAAGRVGTLDFIPQDGIYPTIDSYGGPFPERLNNKFREERRAHCVLDILLTDKSRFEVEDKRFHYDYLGPRLAGNSMQNFVMLVRDLARLSVSAGINRGVAAMVQPSEEEGAVIAYATRMAFENEIAFLIHLGGR